MDSRAYLSHGFEVKPFYPPAIPRKQKTPAKPGFFIHKKLLVVNVSLELLDVASSCFLTTQTEREAKCE